MYVCSNLLASIHYYDCDICALMRVRVWRWGGVADLMQLPGIA